MCSKCKDILKGYKAKHEPSACIFMNASYCSACAIFGHGKEDCPRATVSQAPQYVEQLIPASLMKKYNIKYSEIKTRTPIGTKGLGSIVSLETREQGDILAVRRPTYVEELIPLNILELYNVTTRTPLPRNDIVRIDHPPVLEVYNTNKNIRNLLMDNSIQPSGKVKENQTRIARFASTMVPPRVVDFLTPVDES